MHSRAFIVLVIVFTAGIPAPARSAGMLRTQSGETLEIVSHRVDVVIDHQVARTTVTQVFRNPTPRAQEAVYVLRSG